MKSLIVFIILFWSTLFTAGIFAQSDTKQIRKEVQLEQLNDEIVLTIKTIDGDKVTEEIYTGDEAEKMLSELEKVDEEKIISSEEIKEEIHLEEIEGIKKLTIKKTQNGEISEEIYFGQDADKKIAEIESRKNMQLKISIEE